MPTTTSTTADAFTWPTPAKKLLLAHLKERTSGDADAPNQGLPFIDAKGTLHVKPSDWIDWLTAQGIAAPTRDALQVLKSFGLYNGPVPSGTSKLRRRVTQRASEAETE
jgi:hypothetical protein